ncbi:MAG TPA: enolase C-terminal domain-like protein [Edaphobacter sp.]|nr:enolase C-terminal domain-like protein [Edaphobacter sp.]
MKITAVNATPTSLIVNPKLAIVSAAGTHPESHYLAITIHTDEGIVGHGEATVAPAWSGENQGTALVLIQQMLSTALLGADPMMTNLLADRMDRILIGNPFTKAALEMALLDLKGKILAMPVHMLLGGARRPAKVPLKFSIGAFSPKEAVRIAQHAAGLGLRAAKVKVGLIVEEDIARVQAVRSEMGDDFRLAVDANSGWTEADAVRALPALERLGVNALEQPLRRGDFRGCHRLRQRTHIPLMLDESVFTRQDAMEAIREDACDFISIYPGKNGGILRSMEIAQMAAAAGIECTIGSNLEMDLGTAAMLHLAVAMPNLASTVDHDIIGPLYYLEHLTSTPIRYEDGCAILPEGNGLGVEVQPKS